MFRNVSMKIQTAFFAACLLALVAILPAHATNASGSVTGSASLYAGQIGAVVTSKTVGGTLSEATSNSNGYASNYSNGTGGGNAYAGGNITKSGASVYTEQSSFGTAVSQSAQFGSSTANGTTQHGTDVSSEAVGTFTKGVIGGKASLGFSAFHGH